jgi:hypothetical protein
MPRPVLHQQHHESMVEDIIKPILFSIEEPEQEQQAALHKQKLHQIRENHEEIREV